MNVTKPVGRPTFTAFSKHTKGIAACFIGAVLSLQSIHANRITTSFDEDWSFALGHADERSKDFGHNTRYFSHLSKTGFGDGPASAQFDDRGWRRLDLPHDWANEMPFEPTAKASHGYKKLGHGFPDTSVGWYRKVFKVAEEDLGKRFSIEFDGIYRDADVFINGFFVGNEPSGYLGQSYDLTDYLNYGGDNYLVVRVDATEEEGWFYEGAGIYRHVWLTKTDPLYLVKDGQWIHSVPEGDQAHIQIQCELENKYDQQQSFRLRYRILDADKNVVTTFDSSKQEVEAISATIVKDKFSFKNPTLWDLDNPYLYNLEVEVLNDQDELVDQWNTHFGIRTVEWDPDHGFFLNGKSVKLKGTNNHQDHAGVGAAIPDSLQVWRLEQLKKMGSNAYRASHNPPTPELLDACDRLGILVIDETRLMGINDYHLTQLERMVRRDRNHPSVILWSLGNEEWAIEGNIKGARITKSMQDFCHRLDPTRYTTVAISGGWGGVSHTVQCAGVNYIGQADPDQQHKDYPEQIIIGTEETTTQQTRGVYFRNDERCHLPPLKEGSSKGNAEIGWKFYAEREYTAGVFYWTGFDYRGEPTPYTFPAISSQFGILDTCGFPKDGFYYLKSWWSQEPVLHLYPHWNWAGKEGELIEVRINSNCASAELFLNGKSLGEQKMERNGHLAWEVPYEPGTLSVKGLWADGSERETHVQSTDKPAKVSLEPHRSAMPASKGEVAVVTVAVEDDNGLIIPDAEDEIEFQVKGPGRIIGVGNGNPSSLEPDVFIDQVWMQKLGNWTAPDPNDSKTPVHFEAEFDRPEISETTQATLLLNELGENQVILLNGKPLEVGPEFVLEMKSLKLKETGNILTIDAHPYADWNSRGGVEQKYPAIFKFEEPASAWKRKVFSGLAQVIVESTGEPGTIQLIAKSGGLKSAKVKIDTH